MNSQPQQQDNYYNKINRGATPTGGGGSRGSRGGSSVGNGGGHTNDHQPHRICPRCFSKNTKFCYYNNRKSNQPRYLCKHCKRFWTQGGTLREVPIGGTSRKSKSPKLSLDKTSPLRSCSLSHPLQLLQSISLHHAYDQPYLVSANNNPIPDDMILTTATFLMGHMNEPIQQGQG